MKKPLAPHEKVGRVVRLMGYLGFVTFAAIAVAVAVPMLFDSEPMGPILQFVPMLLLLLIPVFLLWLGSAIKQHKDWARTVGLLYGALLLIGFPIGTIVGVYILWNLILKWDEEVTGPTAD